MSVEYEKTGAALVSVEIALDDALSRETTNTATQQQLAHDLEEARKQVAQLEAWLRQRACEAAHSLRHSESLASTCIQLQQHVLQMHEAACACHDDLGGVGLSLTHVEAHGAANLHAHHPCSSAVVRVEHIAPNSSAAAAAASGLLHVGSIVHKIDMQAINVSV